MSASIKKAMVLTAGLGTRLNPISQKLPKPLVSVLNVPNVLHVLFLLRKSGVKEVVMNLFHLSEKMESFFSNHRFFGLKYEFSHEDPILGPGGGVKNAEKFFTEPELILANCDFVSNLDIKRYIEMHRSKKSKASMLLIQDESKQHLYSKVGVDTDEYLVSLPKLKTRSADQYGIFTGIHILNSDVLDLLNNRPCGINDTLYPKMMKEFPNSVCGFMDKTAFWYDTGDLPVFLETSKKLLERLQQRDPFITELFTAIELPHKEIKPGIWVEEGFSLSKSVQ
ncbi:MAG: NDP-sugar synthase, partial [Deltaproteobacteria bacterium]